MAGQLRGDNRRPVLIHTPFGSIACDLAVHAAVRTTDFLNLPHRFIPIEAGAADVAGWALDGGRLGIRKESILFVAELAAPPEADETRVEASHYQRMAIALRVGNCDVRGFLHVRGEPDPLAVLGRYRGDFLALTAASILGPELQLSSPFVAVNARCVVAVQGQEPVAVTDAAHEPTSDPVPVASAGGDPGAR